MKALEAAKVEQALSDLPGWRLEGGKLVRQWRFADFRQAMAFVNRVAAMAEEADHHPDMAIRYNRVTLGLITHVAGGITERDLRLARQLAVEPLLPRAQ